MIRRHTPEARAAFDQLRPHVRALRSLQDRCRPFSPDYLVLAAPLAALNVAAAHFTGDRGFFAASDPAQRKPAGLEESP